MHLVVGSAEAGCGCDSISLPFNSQSLCRRSALSQSDRLRLLLTKLTLLTDMNRDGVKNTDRRRERERVRGWHLLLSKSELVSILAVWLGPERNTRCLSPPSDALSLPLHLSALSIRFFFSVFRLLTPSLSLSVSLYSLLLPPHSVSFLLFLSCCYGDIL